MWRLSIVVVATLLGAEAPVRPGASNDEADLQRLLAGWRKAMVEHRGDRFEFLTVHTDSVFDRQAVATALFQPRFGENWEFEKRNRSDGSQGQSPNDGDPKSSGLELAMHYDDQSATIVLERCGIGSEFDLLPITCTVSAESPINSPRSKLLFHRWDLVQAYVEASLVGSCPWRLIASPMFYDYEPRIVSRQKDRTFVQLTGRLPVAGGQSIDLLFVVNQPLPRAIRITGPSGTSRTLFTELSIEPTKKDRGNIQSRP